MYINLGCGGLFINDKQWKNFDLVSHYDEVIECNFLKGIELESNIADLVYSSHLLEHLPFDFAPEFLKEHYRVLKPGGVIRIVVPDLAKLIDLYLQYRDKLHSEKFHSKNYEWILIELFDQLSRNHSGGLMGQILKDKTSVYHEIAQNRMGTALTEIVNQPKANSSTITEKVKQKFNNLHYKLIQMILKKSQFQAMKIGHFRLSGECHQWMYDKEYLSYLLTEAGFTQIKAQSSSTSYLSDWSKYYLDQNKSGEAYKPGSLFIEGIKP